MLVHVHECVLYQSPNRPWGMMCHIGFLFQVLEVLIAA